MVRAFRPVDLFSWCFLRQRLFQFRHFREPPTKSLRSGESRGEKGLHQFPGEGVTDHEAAKTNQVQIVVFDTLMRRKVFVNQAGPDPPTLFAQTDAPTPLPQIPMPRSTVPAATARASGTIKSG